MLIVVLGLVTFMLASTGALAQSTGAPVDEKSVARLFDHFVVSGGAITWFILIPMSIATLALIVEHTFSIRPATILPLRMAERIRTDLEARRYLEAFQFTGANANMLCAAVHGGLREAGNGYAAMQRGMADAIDHYAGRLMRKIEYLNVLGNVSPMVGLFGTVYGMIGLFASISDAGGIPEPARIADDISIALVTTFWGLLIAIPALSVFAFFRNRVDELTSECAATAERLLAAFEPPRTGGAVAQPVAAEVGTAFEVAR